jgi:hypothetical protein
MPTVDETIAKIVDAPTWDQRVAQIRLVSQNHGTGDHSRIFAQVARTAYVPFLSPDFAFIHKRAFYEREYFAEVYTAAEERTAGFTDLGVEQLAVHLKADPRILLVLRTITGLTKEEFAHSTWLAGEVLGIKPLGAGKVDSMERKGTSVTAKQARLVAVTLTQIMDGSLFGEPAHEELKRKQVKVDSEAGWASVPPLASNGVPYVDFLHQRHYGGAFRQIIDATSTIRGNVIESAVEAVFADNGVPYIRTGSNNQGDIAERFEITVQPAPDFVVYDNSGSLRAMLECKLTNNGGTARDKAFRFERLRAESIRLGGIPLLAVLGGIGWARVNDTLGPVIRDTEGRVFTLSTLQNMMAVAPFPSLSGLSTQ